MYLLINDCYPILSPGDFVEEARYHVPEDGQLNRGFATWAPDWRVKKRPPPYLPLHEALKMNAAKQQARIYYSGRCCLKIAPSVVGYLGFRVGTISKLSAVITLSQASFTVNHNPTILQIAIEDNLWTSGHLFSNVKFGDQCPSTGKKCLSRFWSGANFRVLARAFGENLTTNHGRKL